MRHNIIKQIQAEIATFADDVDDIIMEGNGQITFERMGNMMTVQLIPSKDNEIKVRYNDREYKYRDFLAKELAHLDLFANKILQKDNADEDAFYVDPKAELITNYSRCVDSAIDILQKECDEPSWDGTRIAFVTADAGHGKTFLLKQFQRVNARSYQEGESDYLFWHIDLHGRDLVRLNEAIMYELGELRITGIYYNSILTLIKNGLIILGIDGFDELSAEKGGDAALGSLTNLCMELEGDGKLVAASRRTFFNTQDYIQRTGIMNHTQGMGCEFDEIRLNNWEEEQCVKFIDIYYSGAQEKFNQLMDIFKSNSRHPLIERPFLFTKLVKMAYEANLTPYEFASHGGETNLDSTNNIIRAFVEREVTKWSLTEKDTGKPYLDFDKHMRLLADIANEMWVSQKDYISMDTVSYLLTILFDEWHTEADLKPKITRMVESHALLPKSSVGDRFRKFDHEEFKNFFLALSFERMLKAADSTGIYTSVKTFLRVAQISDSVAQYLVKQLKTDEVISIMNGLLEMTANDWKSTYIQPNLGTILSFLLDKSENEEMIEIGNKIAFSSVVMENKRISNVRFRDCSFINISFNCTKLKNVEFDSCSFTDIRFKKNSDNAFEHVMLKDNCIVNQVTVIVSEDDAYSEYSPQNIDYILAKQGIIRKEGSDNNVTSSHVNSEFRKAVKQFLNKYTTATYQYEKNIKDRPSYYSRKPDLILNEVIPLLIRFGIIEEVNNRNTQHADTRAWKLKKYTVAEIYKAEEQNTSELYSFWIEVYKHS